MTRIRLIWLLSTIFVGLLLVLAFYAFTSSDSQTASVRYADTLSSSLSDVVFPVEVAVAHRGDLIKRLTTTGTIRAKREVEIVARVGGDITFVAAVNGQFVKKGDVLVEIDDKEYALVFEKARTNLLNAQIDYKTISSYSVIDTVDSLQLHKKLEELEKRFQGIKDLYKAGQESEESLFRAQREHETDLAYLMANRNDVVANRSGLSSARETYERAKLDFDAVRIKAPFNGFVADCDLAAGMKIQQGKTILKLVDLSALFVDVEVLETEIGKIVVGQNAQVVVNAFPKESFQGRIIAINPIVDQKSKTVKVTVELKDGRPRQTGKPLVLRPGMFAAVKLEIENFKDRLIIPKEALLVRDQRTLVFVAREGLAKWHYIDVGEENEDFLEIKSGIDVQDTVIVYGHYTLAHDARVKAVVKE